jgi:uncharacterized protein (DUF433 family)
MKAWIMESNWKSRISADPRICHGKVCIKGTRVMISVILDCLAENMTEDEILAEFPSLKKGDIQVALQYSASLARGEIIQFKSSRGAKNEIQTR